MKVLVRNYNFFIKIMKLELLDRNSCIRDNYNFFH